MPTPNYAISLQEAKLQLESYAFHEAHYVPGSSKNDGVFVFDRVQTLAHRKGIALLTNVIERVPVLFTVGSLPIHIHDPAAWPYETDGDIQEAYGDDVDDLQIADFYEKTTTLEPASSLIIDAETTFLAPRDCLPAQYFGNATMKRYIQVEEIARSLIAGAQLSLV